jgi:ATP-dependent Clp protease ATP-binding subunit ClpA
VRLLIGVLDKGTLRLGDSTQVNFEKTMIFLTTNLGARDIGHELHPEFGFESVIPRANAGRDGKLSRVGIAAVRKHFPPEFINRLDAIVTYRPLDARALRAILDQQISGLQEHIERRLGEQAFRIEVPQRARRFLPVPPGPRCERRVWRPRVEADAAQLPGPAAGISGGGGRNPGRSPRSRRFVRV